jgi:hypothetical protein
MVEALGAHSNANNSSAGWFSRKRKNHAGSKN